MNVGQFSYSTPFTQGAKHTEILQFSSSELELEGIRDETIKVTIGDIETTLLIDDNFIGGLDEGEISEQIVKKLSDQILIDHAADGVTSDLSTGSGVSDDDAHAIKLLASTSGVNGLGSVSVSVTANDGAGINSNAVLKNVSVVGTADRDFGSDSSNVTINSDTVDGNAVTGAPERTETISPSDSSDATKSQSITEQATTGESPNTPNAATITAADYEQSTPVNNEGGMRPRRRVTVYARPLPIQMMVIGRCERPNG